MDTARTISFAKPRFAQRLRRIFAARIDTLALLPFSNLFFILKRALSSLTILSQFFGLCHAKLLRTFAASRDSFSMNKIMRRCITFPVFPIASLRSGSRAKFLRMARAYPLNLSISLLRRSRSLSSADNCVHISFLMTFADSPIVSASNPRICRLLSHIMVPVWSLF